MNYHLFPLAIALFALGGMVGYQAETTRAAAQATHAGMTGPSQSPQDIRLHFTTPDGQTRSMRPPEG